MEKQNKIIRISVRTLVEFLLRSGSLDTQTGPSSEAAMLEGARIHRALQKKSGEGYRAEVSLRMDVPAGDALLRLEGRADGIFFMKDTDPEAEDPFALSSKKRRAGKSPAKKADVEKTRDAKSDSEKPDSEEPGGEKPDNEEPGGEKADGGKSGDEKADGGKSGDGKSPDQKSGSEEAGSVREGLWTIDEIKTVFRGLRELQGPSQVHLAQARCYAYMYACSEGLDRIKIRMTYCSQVTKEVRCFYEELSFEELKTWFTDLVEAYEPWVRLRLSFEETRQSTIRQMEFPFPYREGQYDLAAGVYRTIVHGKKLFLQAPTGTGKTMAVLFPALKAIGEGKAERIFYLTAKGVTGAVAQEALSLLREKGLCVRSLFLVSKERACPCEETDCRPEVCGRADGHFDRVNAALWELLQEAAQGAPMTAQAVADCARRHNVCPYSLSLDAAEFADVIVCDYNYAFHPQARLTRFFDGRNNSILLIDEAHNLLERGRDMYSAGLSYRQVRQFRRSVKKARPRLWREMKDLVQILRQLEQEAAQDNRGICVYRDWTTSGAQAADSAKKAAEENAAGKNAAAEDVIEAAEADTAKTAVAAGAAGADTVKTEVTAEAAEEGAVFGTVPQKRARLYYAAQAVRDRIQWILEQENRSAVLYEGTQTTTEAAGHSDQEFLDFYFNLSHFCQTLRDLDEHYIVYAEKGGGSHSGSHSGRGASGAFGEGARGSSGGGFSLHLYCADPSGHLRECMEGLTSAIFFSATFLPIQYYKGLLGGGPEDFEMYARSSFSPEKRKVVIVRDVTSRYRDRNEVTYAQIARSIGRIVTCRPGNYMVYFPSYAFLENVLQAFCGICSPILLQGDPAESSDLVSSHEMFVLAQKREMTDAERSAFLQAFEEARDDRHLIGFCVLGGMFGEGIDLRSDRLIGSLIVGTGIPPVEPQRELLREYFNERGSNGYDFAYRFPGMNKVLQAAGRVIRTAEDIGIVVLMDGRFSEGSNRELFPLEWGNPESAAGETAAESIRKFWEIYR